MHRLFESISRLLIYLVGLGFQPQRGKDLILLTTNVDVVQSPIKSRKVINKANMLSSSSAWKDLYCPAIESTERINARKLQPHVYVTGMEQRQR